MHSDRPKKKQMKGFQGRLEDMVDQLEIKKTQKPDLVALHAEVEKCLDDTSKHVREISKAVVSAASLKQAMTSGNVVLSDTS